MASLWKHKGLIIRVFGSTFLIFWILNKMEWNKVIEIAKEGSPFYFLAAFVAIQLTVFSSIVKWKMLVDSSLKQDKKQYASFFKLGRLYYIGLFFNNFLPGSVGGDVVRVYYLGRITGVPIATASVAFERITSGMALVVIAVLSSFSMEAARPYVLTTTLVLGIILILLLLVGKLVKTMKSRDGVTGDTTDVSMDKWFIKLKKALLKTSEAALNYRKEHFIWWIKIIMLSLLFQVGLAWINDLLFLSIGIDIPWINLLMIITLISVISMLPISLNGLGVREGCYVFFFKELGVSAETSLTISLLFFIFVSISSLAGGLFWMAERGKHS
ncbi:lysylphosphatidylglycerol synthase transmembrane domain-containing protein [Neobacillus drentensis]|uniref:lysylphosphatidylglycerol synthase transmembrane domain-containing protein n=1 Tax=Neobacillus drentensis TaxID=220684 RepID=UPI002FFEB483